MNFKCEFYAGNMMTDSQRYYIHDNGSRPFMVVIEGMIASVFRVLPDLDYHHNRPECYRVKPEIVVACSEIFIGESPMCAMTIYSGGHGDDFLGNTILLKIGDLGDDGITCDKYVWIGNSGIQSFVSPKIVDFISLVGNNDVPYPYTVDINGDVRLLLDNVILKKGFEFNLATVSHDPYRWFYDNHQLCEWPVLSPGRVYIPGYDGILTYYHVNNDGHREQYILRYNSNPEKEYDRFAARGEFSHLIIALVENGVILEKLLTRDAYVALMTKFGRERGWEYFHMEEISPRFE